MYLHTGNQIIFKIKHTLMVTILRLHPKLECRNTRFLDTRTDSPETQSYHRVRCSSLTLE